MNIEEKLKLFDELCSKQAKEEYTQIMQEYQDSLEEMLAKHKEIKTSDTGARLRGEEKILQRDFNKEYSLRQTHWRQAIEKKQNELRQELFARVLKRLLEVKKTDKYLDYLCRKTEMIIRYAEDEPFELYMDASDLDLMSKLEKRYSISIRVSSKNIYGGIQGIIPSRNLLIDESFYTHIEEEEDKFRLDGSNY